jgi:hypothetical protein
MTLRGRIAVAAIAALVVVLLAGGIGAGVTLGHRRVAAGQAASSPAPAVATPMPVTRHSLIGRVVAVEGDRVLVRDRQRVLREVRLTGATAIRKQRRLAPHGVLAPGARVAVLGRPSPDRALVARLIVVESGPGSR